MYAQIEIGRDFAATLLRKIDPGECLASDPVRGDRFVNRILVPRDDGAVTFERRSSIKKKVEIQTRKGTIALITDAVVGTLDIGVEMLPAKQAGDLKVSSLSPAIALSPEYQQTVWSSSSAFPLHFTIALALDVFFDSAGRLVLTATYAGIDFLDVALRDSRDTIEELLTASPELARVTLLGPEQVGALAKTADARVVNAGLALNGDALVLRLEFAAGEWDTGELGYAWTRFYNQGVTSLVVPPAPPTAGRTQLVLQQALVLRILSRSVNAALDEAKKAGSFESTASPTYEWINTDGGVQLSVGLEGTLKNALPCMVAPQNWKKLLFGPATGEGSVKLDVDVSATLKGTLAVKPGGKVRFDGAIYPWFLNLDLIAKGLCSILTVIGDSADSLAAESMPSFGYFLERVFLSLWSGGISGFWDMGVGLGRVFEAFGRIPWATGEPYGPAGDDCDGKVKMDLKGPAFSYPVSACSRVALPFGMALDQIAVDGFGNLVFGLPSPAFAPPPFIAITGVDNFVEYEAQSVCAPHLAPVGQASIAFEFLGEGPYKICAVIPIGDAAKHVRMVRNPDDRSSKGYIDLEVQDPEGFLRGAPSKLHTATRSRRFDAWVITTGGARLVSMRVDAIDWDAWRKQGAKFAADVCGGMPKPYKAPSFHDKPGGATDDPGGPLTLGPGRFRSPVPVPGTDGAVRGPLTPGAFVQALRQGGPHVTTNTSGVADLARFFGPRLRLR